MNPFSRRTKCLRGVAALTAGLSWGAFVSAPAWAAAPAWSAVSVISPAGSPFFSTMTCLSTTNCWSPGYSNVVHKGVSSTHAAMEHWDGTQWSPVATPVAGAMLGRVDCTSTGNCWVAGYLGTSTGQDTPVVEHWNGATWAEASLPPVTSGKGAYTDSVTCVSPSECFAMGGAVQSSTSFGAPFSPLVFHFDGTKWSIMAKVAKPNGYKSADVEEMRCPTATSCVAEGVEIPTGSYFDHVYSQTFNGSTWTVVQMPQPYHDQYSYADTPDLTCSSPSQCVAPVNAAADANGKTLYSPFIELWNGTSWKLLTVAPSVSKSFSEFTDMACVAGNNCWATQMGGAIDNWRGGSSWTVGSVPGAAGANLDAVGCVSGASCYVLGATYKGAAIADRLVVASSATLS